MVGCLPALAYSIVINISAHFDLGSYVTYYRVKKYQNKEFVARVQDKWYWPTTMLKEKNTLYKQTISSGDGIPDERERHGIRL